MSEPSESPVTVPQTLSALVLQRLGAAVTGFQPATDHWIMIGADGRGVRRVEKTSDTPPRTRPDEHAFALAAQAAGSLPRARIVRMTVDIEAADGTVRRDVPVDVAGLDALFLDASAIDKFVVPYYCATFGIKHALQLLDQWNQTPGMAAFCHTPWSEDCSVSDDG